MPLTKIAIEQTLADGWIAELEAGGVLARNARLRAPSLEALLDQIRVTHRALAGTQAPSAGMPSSFKRA
jgi:hypothetical protein